MQLEGVCPDAVTFVCSLKACGSIGAIEFGRGVHTEAAKQELERNHIVGRALVDMYSKCGLLEEAHEMCGKLPVGDVALWNTLIAGYADHGLGEEVLNCMEQMCLEVVSADAVTFVGGLKACGRTGAMYVGQEIHAEIAKQGLERDPIIGSTLVDMYAKCGLLAEGREVFDKLPVQDAVSWTALMAGFAEHGLNEEALYCFQQMDLEGVSPDAITFVCGLKVCSSIGAIDRGREIHAKIVKQRSERDHFVSTTLMDMYAKCGSLSEAQEVFDKLPVRDVVSWNVLIAGYAEHNLGEEMLNCFQQMQFESVSPDVVTFLCSVKACGIIGDLDRGRGMHAEIVKQGLDQDCFVGNTFVVMYAKCGSLAEAQEVLDKLPARDVISWNALIKGYAEHGIGEEVLNCFQLMQLEGVSPDAVTFVCSLKACGSLGAIDQGREIHAEITKEGYDRDGFVGNTVVDMYVKCSSVQEAWEVFDKLLVQDGILWNTLIGGYTVNGLGEEALNFLEQMQLEGVHPDVVILVGSLKACGSTGDIKKGREIYAEIAKNGFDRDPIISRILVDMYAKCGSLAEARGVLDKIPVRDVISWTALIAGYAEHGFGEEALSCLEQMQVEGISADDVTMICCLKACGNLRAIDRGRKIHAEIAKQGFERKCFVGSTLVDMYVKCGLLAEAWEVFDKLQVRDAVSWNTVIAGFAEHGLGEEALNCLQQMQLEGVSLDAFTFVSLLRACGRVGAVDKVQKIHAEITKRGFERDSFVGSTLIDMYAKCGSLAEAQEIFDRLMIGDAASWTSLIAAYAEHGFGEETLNFFQQMQLVGMSPDAFAFACSLRACGTISALDKGREIHAEIVKQEFERDRYVGSTLVNMYVKCGSLAEAQEVLDKVPVQDVVSWTTLIAGYAEHGLGDEVLSCLEHMQLKGVSLDAVTFVCSLKVCGTIETVDKGRELHTGIAKHGFEADGLVGNTLVDMYIKCGLLAEAREVFDKLSVQDVVSWNVLIAGYAEHRLDEEALNCLGQMLLEGVTPDAVTFVCSLKACSSIIDIDRGRQIHILIVKQGCERDPFVDSTLVDMYAKCGALAEARELFDKLTIRDVISWTALIAGYAEHRCVEEALNFLEQMKLEGVSPDAVVFVCSLKACGSIGDIDSGRKVHAEVAKQGLETDTIVNSTLVDMYSKCGSIAEAQEVLDKLPVRDLVSWTSLIAGYAECRLGEQALNCFQQMQLEGLSPDVVSWNAMILGYPEQDLIENAFELFAQMQEQGVSPNSVTFLSVLKACGNTVALETGKKIYRQICRVGLHPDGEVILATALIDMYGKCGSMVDAQQVFDSMPRGVLVTWNALITGYARQGESELVFYLLERTKKEGLQPDGITFLSVLTVCSHVGLVDKGRKYFEGMNRDYGVTPSVKHHNCMIDLLGRAGQLDEAVAMLEKLPFQPDLALWSTVLGACQKWGNVELGRQAFDYAVRLDEKHVAAYILMFNIYADAHMWEDAKKIKAQRLSI